MPDLLLRNKKIESILAYLCPYCTGRRCISKSYFLIKNVRYLMKNKKVRTEQNDFRSVRKKKLFSYSLQYAAAVLAVRAALL